MWEDNGIADTEYTCAMFDVTPPTLSRMLKQSPNIKASRGRWRLDEVEAALSARRSHPSAMKTNSVSIAGRPSADLADALAQARLSKAQSDAEKAAYATRRAAGALVERTAVIEAAVAIVTAARARLEGLPARIAADLVGRPVDDIRDRLAAEIEAALADLSRLETSADVRPT